MSTLPTFRANRVIILALAGSCLLTPAVSQAQGRHQAGPARMERTQAEPERDPLGYPRIQRPDSLAQRPERIDRQRYNHNFTARTGYRIGPYRAPAGYAYRRWTYGQTLPRAFWVNDYWIADYWLFGWTSRP